MVCRPARISRRAHPAARCAAPRWRRSGQLPSARRLSLWLHSSRLPRPRIPLDPPTIRSIQERIRGLLPNQLAAFSRTFRTAFQVPESTPSITQLMSQQRHPLWIQCYLAQGLDQGQPHARTT